MEPGVQSPECVLLVEDHPAIRNSLERVLKRRWASLHAGTANEAKAFLSREKPVAAIVDLGLPGGGALPLIAELNERGMKVIVFSATDDDCAIAQVAIAGAVGFLGKAHHEQEVVVALETVLADDDRRFFPDGYAAPVNALPTALHSLTPAERRVLVLLGEALSTKELSARLHRSERTIDGHRAALIRKLGIPSAELTRYAVAIRTGNAFKQLDIGR